MGINNPFEMLLDLERGKMAKEKDPKLTLSQRHTKVTATSMQLTLKMT